ncbi:hypothetical protein EV126DRAFT_417315 [Verticillium dahliae]|nr:hypothetical protein EV126DRAFT_417315 [Verticillium dahliae]
MGRNMKPTASPIIWFLVYSWVMTTILAGNVGTKNWWHLTSLWKCEKNQQMYCDGLTSTCGDGGLNVELRLDVASHGGNAVKYY